MKKELDAWLLKPDKKKIITLSSLLIRLREGRLNNKEYIFCYYRTYLVSFLQILQKYQYIKSFYVVPAVDIEGRLLLNPVLVVFLPEVPLPESMQYRLQMYSRQRLFCYMSYKQVVYLVARSKNIYLYNTPVGILTHEDILKKKIGGQLICSLL